MANSLNSPSEAGIPASVTTCKCLSTSSAMTSFSPHKGARDKVSATVSSFPGHTLHCSRMGTIVGHSFSLAVKYARDLLFSH